LAGEPPGASKLRGECGGDFEIIFLAALLLALGGSAAKTLFRQNFQNFTLRAPTISPATQAKS